MNSTQLGWSEALRAAGVVSITSSVLLHVVVIRNLLADIGENSRMFKCGTTSSDQDFQSSNIFELNINTDTLFKFMENECHNYNLLGRSAILGSWCSSGELSRH